MNLLLKLLLLLASFMVGCGQAHVTDDELLPFLENMKAGQAKVHFKIDDSSFYPDANIFIGSVSLSHGTMALNFKDQFQGQVILSMQLPGAPRSRPWDIHFADADQREGSVLIGKIIDQVNNKGLGYVMTSGNIAVSRFDRGALIMRVEGTAGKYGAEGPSVTKNPLSGWIVVKEPNVSLDELTWEDLLP